MRKVFECYECGFAWHSPWWEPTFVGRWMAKKEHAIMHSISLRNTASWRDGGAQEEQQRIIKLLESLKGTCDNDCDECRPYADKNDHYLSEVIALLKGENK